MMKNIWFRFRCGVSPHLYGAIAFGLLLFASCSDNHIWPSSEEEEEEPGKGIAFDASVVSSTVATRADGSIVNRLETEFPGPGTKYYEYAGEGVAPTEKIVDYGIGLYGVYTGPHTWHEMMDWATEPKKVEGDVGYDEYLKHQKMLQEYYTANLFYNQKATIGAPVDGRNPLIYSPERFWPNNKVDATDYERATFWAYYPWNDEGNPGEYGVHIVSTDKGVNTSGGMGKVQYTMHPDAAQQSDFMISEIVADRSKSTNPLQESGSDRNWTPTRVPLRFHHMLAQVRLFAFIRGTDKVVYQTKPVDGEEVAINADEAWLSRLPSSKTSTIIDLYGNTIEISKDKEGAITEIKNVTLEKTLTQADFLALKLKVPDEENTVRWWREDGVPDINNTRRRANITYSMSFNNIHTSATFSPTITYQDGRYITKANYTTEGTLGSATVNHYIMNPYWFRFDDNGQRVMLNENYMFDYFEDTPAYKGEKSAEGSIPTGRGYDGIDWSTRGSNCLSYTDKAGADFASDDNYIAKEILNSRVGKHYNYPPGNILLVVPQELDDAEVPNITITAQGYQADADGTKKLDANGNPIRLTAKVTINMLQMNLKWESGFIYCYAFLDELQPGDDKVRGPETITVIFDPTRITDQW